jgi:hypothetical protein
MVQCTKIFYVLILKRFIGRFKVFSASATKQFLRRKIVAAQAPAELRAY